MAEGAEGGWVGVTVGVTGPVVLEGVGSCSEGLGAEGWVAGCSVG